ncbi:hypothetical protein [Streptococcus constellatus]|uniref:hypothetical protein n=1 Tax=Streptococcus constellatus TaxID=76860 RepID=UPI00066ADA49|nr:hypothetical protein [Streptococcus constellatus]
MKFVVYKHSLVLGDNNIVTKQFIVLKHDDGNLQFTDFHRYVESASKIKSISDVGGFVKTIQSIVIEWLS